MDHRITYTHTPTHNKVQWCSSSSTGQVFFFVKVKEKTYIDTRFYIPNIEITHTHTQEHARAASAAVTSYKSVYYSATVWPVPGRLNRLWSSSAVLIAALRSQMGPSPTWRVCVCVQHEVSLAKGNEEEPENLNHFPSTETVGRSRAVCVPDPGTLLTP